jgi:N-acetyl-alpha-D-glucosaminyl L-malate synthase BshA
MADGPLRIGITCYPTAGGSGIIATELGMRLAARGHHVHFICAGMPIRLRAFDPRISFHPVEAASYPVFQHQPYSLNLAATMSEVVESHELDLLHVHYAIPHAVSAVLARQIVRPRRLRVLTTLHGTDITLVGQQPSFHRVTRYSIDESDAVSVVSEWLAARTRSTFGTVRPLDVVHNFVDPERFRPLPGRPERQRFAAPDELLVLHASNFRPVKNTPRVIEVFEVLARELPVRLLMIGEGPELPRCEQLARDRGLAGRVTFVGSQQYIESLLPLADLVLVPSAHESFGLTALEAMSCGVPVVTTAAGGSREVVDDGTSGYLVDVDDLPALVEAARAILVDGSRRRTMGEAGRRAAVACFHIDAAVTRYEALYARLLAAGDDRG